nr:copia protein [Tanacetum cinerariifolium]
MENQKPLLKDEDGEEVDVYVYRLMIGSLMYLTSSRPDIMFVVCACARYQVNQKVSHLYAVKRIFRYLKGQLKLDLWYPKYSPFDLVAYTDSDYAGASLDRKSTTRGSLKKDTQALQPSDPIKNVIDEAVYKELGDRLVRATTTASSLEVEQDSESLGENASKQERIDVINADEEITLVSVQDKVVSNDADKQMFDVDVLDGRRSVASDIVSTAGAATTVSDAITTTATIITVGDINLTQSLKEINITKPKEKEIVIQELGKSTTTKSLQQLQDKGKVILIEPVIEPVKPIQRKDQIRLDEEAALKLQDAFDEEERLAREKAKNVEDNTALIKTWDDIQAKIDVDHQLAERMQVQEQEELFIAEKATLFQQLLEKKRKYFAAKRAEEKRNKPPIKAQQRKIMCTYLKNMEGYKLKDLKLKEFDSIQEMFYRAFKRVNTFEDFRTELVEGKEKRAGTELIEKITKKQKVENEKEIKELKQFMEIIPDEEEVAINAIHLSVKSLTIVDWKIYKKGIKIYYQIIRADGKSQTYMVFSQMLKSFNMEDLEDLYKLVKAKYESIRPVEDLDLLL